MIARTIIGYFILSLFFQVVAQQPLPRSAAHNDYWHDQPLIDALNLGFISVEADVYARGDRLVVSHNPPLFRKNKTLTSLYLEPLQKHVQENGGSVHSEMEEPFVLLIDLKLSHKKSWPLLLNILETYHELFWRIENGEVVEGPVRVIVTGSRPAMSMGAKNRIASLDGIPALLGFGFSPDEMPWVSESYRRVFKWKGKGEVPPDELTLLQSILDSAHQENKKLRLYHCPENETVWEVLANAGVDFIAIDEIERFSAFMQKRALLRPEGD